MLPNSYSVTVSEAEKSHKIISKQAANIKHKILILLVYNRIVITSCSTYNFQILTNICCGFKLYSTFPICHLGLSSYRITKKRRVFEHAYFSASALQTILTIKNIIAPHSIQMTFSFSSATMRWFSSHVFVMFLKDFFMLSY